MASRKEQKELARQERDAREADLQSDRGSKRRALTLLGIVAAAAVIVALAIVLSSGDDDSGDAITGGTEVEQRFSGIDQDGTTLGAKDAPVTMVEFADLKCPFCRDFSVDVLPELIDRYVKNGQLRIEFEPQAFVAEAVAPGDSEAAARMALALADEDKFWQFTDLFYLNQKDESETYATDSFLRSLAQEIPGVDADAALKNRAANAITDRLERAAEAFQSNGLTGTPGFLIGQTGTTLSKLPLTDLSLEEFTSAIDAALEESK